ncbi:MFS transporter [Sporolactobacillus sp. KGMB 08714]|uniref:MFS transporter n=1 Tax=Sporolactobacillus sp. KGMB 08714 TaxID=3064704 RepID=UPI002FBD942A
MDETEKNQESWHRNLHVLWFCTFIASMAFSEIMPFLSLYVNSLGNFTKQQVTFYSGLVYAANFLVMAFASPLWGILADRKGRKIMLLRASLGTAVVMALMGTVTHVWELVAFRALQGVFAGFISNAQALVAGQTPKEHSGAALSTLMTGATSGILLGPVIGGTLAQIFSIRLTFFITAGLLFLTFLLSYFCVQENFRPVKHPQQQSRHRNPLAMFPNPKLIIVLFCSTLIVQFGNVSISPIISLYVKELMHDVGPITIVAGLIAALPGISNIVASPPLGRYGDRHGSGRVLIFGYIFATVMYLPQGFVHSIWLLALLRLMIGISDGALFPEIQTLLTKNSPAAMTSTIFSWNQSFQALGNMLGSLLGGIIAGAFDYNAVFISTAMLMLINFILVWWLIPEIRRSQTAAT